MDLRSLLKKLQDTVNTGISNIRGNVQAIANPQTRSTWMRGLQPTSIPKPIQNLQQNIRIVSNPKTAQTWSQGFNNTVPGTAAKYLTNRYIAPVAQIPYNIKQITSPKTNLAQKGIGSLGVLGGVATLVPDPIQDVALPAFDLFKGAKSYQLQNKDKKLGAFEALTKGGIPAMTLEKPVGLGEALTTNKTGQTIGNIAEFPLAIATTGKFNKKASGAWSKEQIEMVRRGFSPEVRNLVGRFAEIVESSPNANRKNLGWLGEYIQSLAETVFGKEIANLTNKQLKNAFDSIMEVANRGKGIREPFNIGLSVKNIRKDFEEQPTYDKRLPKIMYKISKKEAEVDPFLKGLEEQAKLPQNKYPAIEIPTDKTAKYQATIKGGGFTGKVEQDVKNTFANWVNNRRATKVEGLLKQKEFADLDKKGINGILEFQSGNKTGRFAEVKKYFDTKYNQVKNSGIDVNYKKNYLPQLWANPPEQVEQILGRKLSQKPSFSLQSLIKDYEAGIKGGLTPKFNTISQLVSWYERIANKTLADVNFFNKIAKEGLIQPSGKSPRGWKTLNPDSFPKISVNIPGEYRYSGTYSAPSELADMINNYLSTPEQSGTLQKNLSGIASFVSAAKNRMLSFGIPSTGINFHGFNILSRSYLEGGVKGALKTAWYMVNPDAAAKYVEQNLTKAPDAIKSGLSFSTSEYANSLESSGLRTKFGNAWNNLFEKPLFEKIISANKLEGWSKLVQEYSKEMPEDIAKKEAAKFINTVYGGINWEELGRSRDIQNLFRVAALTPDWLESNLKLGAGMVKGLLDIKNPAGKAYRRAFTNLVAAYATLTTINKMTSGHNMWENEPGHTFELEAGYTADGQKRYYRPFGTAVDFIRLPVDIVQAALKGDFSVPARVVRNRLSTIVQPGAALLFNVNWKGQPVYGKDKYGNQMTAAQQIGGVASELGTLVGFPSFLREGIDYATGKQELEPALTQGLELPFRYSGGAYSTSQKQLRPIAEQQGLSGEDKYNLYKKLQGQSKFSDKQMGVIQEGGLQDVLDKRQETALDNKAKKQLKESGQDILESNNKIYIKQEDGSIKTIDPTFQPKKPELTGNTELDKKLISRFNGEITSKANNIVDLYEAGKLSKDDAEKQLNDLTTLKSNFSKSSKPKTPKTIKIKKTTFPTIKISKGKSYKIKLSKFKSPKVKKEKVPKFKIIKPKRLKIKDVKL